MLAMRVIRTFHSARDVNEMLADHRYRSDLDRMHPLR